MVLFTIILWGILVGNPSIVIRNGEIDRKVLKKNHMDINQLLRLLRQEGIFSIRKVSYVILEPNGTISVLKYSEYETPTKSDLGLHSSFIGLTFTLISDGKVDESNLRDAGFNRNWLDPGIGKTQYPEN